MTWMISIARNLAIDHVRKTARETSADDLILLTLPSECPTAFEAIEALEEDRSASEQQQQVFSALQALNPARRDLVVRAYLYGESQRAFKKGRRAGEYRENLDQKGLAGSRGDLAEHGTNENNGVGKRNSRPQAFERVRGVLPKVPLFRSSETAVTSWAAANGLSNIMLFGTPLEAESSALSPLIYTTGNAGSISLAWRATSQPSSLSRRID